MWNNARTLDTYPTYPRTRLHCAQLVGLDIYRPYLLALQNKNVEALQCDAREGFPFQDKSFDVILMLDFLEHLPSINFISHALTEAVRIARKNVIVLTPTDYDEQNIYGEDSYVELGYKPNTFQHHRLVVTKFVLMNHGFHVKQIVDEGGKEVFVWNNKIGRKTI